MSKIPEEPTAPLTDFTDGLVWYNASIEEQLRIHDAYWGTPDDTAS